MACAGCGKQLGSRFFKLDSRYFHHDCFVCATCGAPLSSGYFEQGGEIYCQSHIPHTMGTVPRPTVGDKPSGYLDTDSESVEKKTCSVCYGLLKTDAYLAVESEVVHKRCWNCTACSKPFGKNPYFYHGPGVYLCEKDHVWATGQDDSDWLCNTCKKPAHDSVIMVRGKKYHPQCIKCSTKGCTEPAKYLELDNNYCQTHMPSGAEITHRIDRKSTVSTPRGGGDDDLDGGSSPGRVSRPIAKRDIVKFNPRGPREQVEYDTTKKEYKQPSNPFASRDGKIGTLPEAPALLPYTSTRPVAFQTPQRKFVSPNKTTTYSEDSSNDNSSPSSSSGALSSHVQCHRTATVTVLAY